VTDLKVSFFGQTLKTPFILASGAQTTMVGTIHKYAETVAKCGWSGMVMKTVGLDKPDYVRPYLWSSKEYRLKAMQNSGSRLAYWKAQMLEKLKSDVDAAHKNGLILLGSISGSTTEQLQQLANDMQAAGVDGIEIDMSCPTEVKSTSEKMSAFFENYQKEYTEQAISEIKKVFKGPIVPKLSFHSFDIGVLAKVCEQAGASAISAINTIQGVIGIDVNSGVPICSGWKNNSYRSGISGPNIKPFGLSAVSKICRATQLPVSGIGGIGDWKSAVEYIMVGATTVQICTAAMWHGFDLAERLSKGMKKFMSQQGYQSVEEFRGISLQYFSTEVPTPVFVKASIDKEKCNDCGLCLKACRDGAYDAIELIDSVHKINHDICDGCGLCLQVCPQKAIRLNAVKTDCE